LREFFVTFGRVPLFFYLLQWYAVLLNVTFGKPVQRLFQTPSTGSARRPMLASISSSFI